MPCGATGALPDAAPGLCLRVPPGLSVVRALRNAGHAVTTGPTTRRTVALHDTGDRRLAAAGAELTFTAREGWRWRRGPAGHPKLAVREWTAPATAQAELLNAWTRAYRRGRPLGARATVRVDRRVHEVAVPGHTAPLSIVEECVSERRGEAWTPRLRRLTVADDDSAAAVLAAVPEAEVDSTAAVAVLRPALVRATPVLVPPGEATSARDLFSRSVALSLVQWVYFDGELGSGSADALRKLRVALRRLRTDLQAFAPLLDQAWADALRDRLAGLAGRLGTVRDAEVLCDRLGSLLTSLPEDERPAAAPLLDAAAARLVSERAGLLDEVSHAEYVSLLDATVEALSRPRWRGDDVEPPSIAELSAKPWRRLRRLVGSFEGEPDDEQLHRIRILAKRARYAAAAAIPVVGEPAARAAAAVADLQTVLGDHHDAVVTRGWLQAQAAAAADVAFAAGVLSGLELDRSRVALEAWRGAWNVASHRRNWRWLNS